MYRISHGGINTSTRRDSTADLSKKITTCNMNGTINATSRRDLLIQKDIEHKDHKDHNTEPVKTTPVPATRPVIPNTEPVKTTPKPAPTPRTVVPTLTSDNLTQLKLNEVRDQYVKISTSLSHINSVSNNVKKDVNAYKKLTDEQIGNLSISQKQTSDDLNAYKKLTDERIEKIANLFLSINK